MSSDGPKYGLVAALLTRMSSRPCAASIAADRLRDLRRLADMAGVRARLPARGTDSAATVSQPSSLRLAATTIAPWLASSVCDRAADAAARAGDEGDAAAEVELLVRQVRVLAATRRVTSAIVAIPLCRGHRSATMRAC